MLAPGDVVDRYVILAVLGQGGMGAVYHARDERLQREVALKILRADEQVDLDTEGAARMVREARAIAALEHPNVVTIYDVGELTLPGATAPTAYLAMELVRGKSLRAYVGDASVAVARRVAWLVEIAEALDAVHALGLVHRDVKPENVMIRDDGHAKVLDFGIAKRAHLSVAALSTSAGQVLSTITSNAPRAGTPLYMAPEQMLDEPLDGRTDQFAWGVVAYELLAGVPPWGKELDAVMLVAAIVSKEAPRLDEHALGLAPGIADVVARALAKAPAARFRTMRDLIAALRTPAASPSKAVVEAPRARRRGAVPYLLGASALMAAIAIGASFSRGRAPATASSAIAAPSAVVECRTNADCGSSADAPRICRKTQGRCAPLATATCTVHADAAAIEDDDTVWLGAMYPLSGDDGRLVGKQNWQATDLARQDFDATIGSKSAQATRGKARRIGLVACDDLVDAAASARHLVETVGVPAILGFRSGTELFDLAGEILGRDVLAVASLTTNPLLTTIPHRDGQPRLVWRTTYSAVQAASAIGAFIPGVVERELRDGRSPVVDDTHPMKIAMLRTKDRNLSPIAEAFFSSLRFNGKSVLDNAMNYRELVWDSAAPDRGAADLASIADALVLYAPHVIVLNGGTGNTIVDGVVRKVEERWPRGARHRPRWLELSVLNPDLFPLIGKDSDRRHRFFGVTTASATPANARFVLHYNETFDDKVSRAFSPNSAYDAFYLLAYAVYALGDDAVTGPALARAMARLVPSTDDPKPRKTIDVGIAGIFEAYNTLRHGGAIDLNGATGALDFDLATGESEFDQDVLCVGTDDRGVANDSVESGLVYAARDKKLRGAMKCP